MHIVSEWHELQGCERSRSDNELVWRGSMADKKLSDEKYEKELAAL